MPSWSSQSFCLLTCFFSISIPVSAYELAEHPRIFVRQADLGALATRASSVLSRDYWDVKAEADRAIRDGIRRSTNRFRTPTDQICLGITYLVERELGHESQPYADAIKAFWADGQVLSRDGSGHFGYYAMIYDWIFDAMSPEERRRFGNALGPWLRWYTDSPEITLKNGYWWYNQTWGPAHLNTPNTRDGITPKLLLALAIAGAGTDYESDARKFLDSWADRVPRECIPAFDEMGGVWSESMGHGNYGPVIVIPWAFEAWRTATGEDLFQKCAPCGFLPSMTQWAIHLTVPFSNQTAWIDDNSAGSLGGFSQVAPILAARYRDRLANGISDQSVRLQWQRTPWNRLLSYDPAVGSEMPTAESAGLASYFPGAGHVYMRSRWNDPDATWAFFGAGPKFAGHSRDDEGHFLIANRGWLVLRAGGNGHNDGDYYAGGSLAFNLVTIYDPDEVFRRTDPGPRAVAEGGVKNENDGGLIRYVYSRHTRDDRGKIVTYYHDAAMTYAAADLTQGYRANKVREVSRQFLYWRGHREYFVIFDRVEATGAQFPKTWFLHIPTEPQIDGTATVETPDHVWTCHGNTTTWVSSPAGEEPVLSQGRSRAFLKTLLPEQPVIVKRGGAGHEFWGHPKEPTAQYNHVGRDSRKPPIVPWRLEVQGVPGKTRDYFLHVLEIGAEDDSAMSPVELIRRDREVGVRLSGEPNPVEIVFSADGRISARVQHADETLILQ